MRNIVIEDDVYKLLSHLQKVLEERSGRPHTLSQVIRELFEVLDTFERGAVISGHAQIELDRLKCQFHQAGKSDNYEAIIQELITFWRQSKE